MPTFKNTSNLFYFVWKMHEPRSTVEVVCVGSVLFQLSSFFSINAHLWILISNWFRFLFIHLNSGRLFGHRGNNSIFPVLIAIFNPNQNYKKIKTKIKLSLNQRKRTFSRSASSEFNASSNNCSWSLHCWTFLKQNAYNKDSSHNIAIHPVFICLSLLYGQRFEPIDNAVAVFFLGHTKLWAARTCCANRPCRCSVFCVLLSFDARTEWMFFLSSLDLLPTLPDSTKKRKHFYLHLCGIAPKISKWPLQSKCAIRMYMNICCSMQSMSLAVFFMHKKYTESKIQVLHIMLRCWLSAFAVHNQFLFSFAVELRANDADFENINSKSSLHFLRISFFFGRRMILFLLYCQEWPVTYIQFQTGFFQFTKSNQLFFNTRNFDYFNSFHVEAIVGMSERMHELFNTLNSLIDLSTAIGHNRQKKERRTHSRGDKSRPILVSFNKSNRSGCCLCSNVC